MHTNEQAGLEEFIPRSVSFPLYEHTWSPCWFCIPIPTPSVDPCSSVVFIHLISLLRDVLTHSSEGISLESSSIPTGIK